MLTKLFCLHLAVLYLKTRPKIRISEPRETISKNYFFNCWWHFSVIWCMFDGIFDDDPLIFFQPQNYFFFSGFYLLFLLFIKHSFVPRGGFLLSVDIITFLFVLGFLSLLFFLLWILHRKSSSISSIFIATFRTKIVQTLHEFQNQFIYYSREFLKKLKWNFHSFFFPCASNQSWACLPMLSTVPKCKCFTQNQKMMVELQNLLNNQTFLLFTFKKLKLNAFECLMPFEAF